MVEESKKLTLEELGELNAYFGEHGELPHGVEEAPLEMAVGYHELRSLVATEPLERWAVRVLDESAGNHAKKTGKLGTYEMTVATASDGSLSWAVDVPGYELFGEETPDLARIAAARALCAESPELPKGTG